MDSLLNAGKALLPIAGGALFGPAGAAGGQAIAGLFGGGGSSGGSSGQRNAGQNMNLSSADLIQLSAQLAAQNTPLTLATQRYGSQLGLQEGALGLYGRDLSAANRSYFDYILNSALASDGFRAAEALEATRGKGNLQKEGLDRQYDLADRGVQARIALNLLGPTTAAQAGMAALNNDFSLQQNLASTNQGIKGLQEGAKLNIAQRYGQDLGQAFQTRAGAQADFARGFQGYMGNLGLGKQTADAALARDAFGLYGNQVLNKQKTDSELALKDFDLYGNLTLNKQRYDANLAELDSRLNSSLTLNKAQTESDIARTRASAAATKDLRRNAMDIAMTGQRYFG